MNDSAITHSHSIRSFVVRAGRITAAQLRALEELWPRYGIALVKGHPLDLENIFERLAPKILEIGFGNGDNLAALAQAQPHCDFLGAEVHRPGIGHLLQRIQQLGLGNVRVVADDAVELLESGIAPGALDGVVILFPDPWHKKRHHKRRLIQEPFVSLLASRLRHGGRVELATDWEPYALQMREVLDANPQFTNLAADRGFVDRPDWRTSTRFERRGVRLGHGVWDLAYLRT